MLAKSACFASLPSHGTPISLNPQGGYGIVQTLLESVSTGHLRGDVDLTSILHIPVLTQIAGPHRRSLGRHNQLGRFGFERPQQHRMVAGQVRWTESDKWGRFEIPAAIVANSSGETREGMADVLVRRLGESETSISGISDAALQHFRHSCGRIHCTRPRNPQKSRRHENLTHRHPCRRRNHHPRHRCRTSGGRIGSRP